MEQIIHIISIEQKVWFCCGRADKTMTMTDSEASMGLEMATSRKEREEQGLLSVNFSRLEVERSPTYILIID